MHASLPSTVIKPSLFASESQRCIRASEALELALERLDAKEIEREPGSLSDGTDGVDAGVDRPRRYNR